MNEKNKNILLGVLIVGIISMTVAFAALSTRLNIGGQASVASANWNVHFDNFKDVTENTITNEFGTQQNTAVHPAVSDLRMSDSTNVTKVEGLNITLKQPNDYARYTFEIVNDGSIDAQLDSFTPQMTCTSNNNCSDVVDYEVKCYEDSSLTGTEVTNDSLLEKNGGAIYCYLQVQYKDKTNNNGVYTQEGVSASLSANWTWKQSTESNNNEQGGNQEQGGENPTPSNPYETDFTGTYNYKIFDGWSNSLDSDYSIFLRQNAITNEEEVCATFESGTACFKKHEFDCSPVMNSTTGKYECTNTAGYISNKITEFEQKGAVCTITDSGSTYGVKCTTRDNIGHGCISYSDGHYQCFEESDTVYYSCNMWNDDPTGEHLTDSYCD